MRASVASISKKFISSFFAATLALGLVPAAAFAAPEDATIAANETTEEESPNSVISTEASESERSGEIFSEEVIQDDPIADASASASEVDPIEENAATGDDSNLSIPAALERINEDVALTQPVAQQESTRSYFLAQTLESTKTVPIVSANLPLDTGTSSDVVEPEAEGEGNDSTEGEGGEDSDESDLPTSNIIAADSTVIGSFEYNGIVYAIEPGGETVAVIAADYAKLPETSIEKNTLVIPSFASVVTDYGLEFNSVTRIADYAFASLTSEAASQHVISSEVEKSADTTPVIPSDSEESGEALTDSAEDAENEEPSTNEGITILGIPSSITSIGDDAFAGFSTLQYIVVEEGNPSYASYDGALYSADLTNLRLIPEGRVGTIRVAPSATTVDPEAFSHCPSVDTVVADPASEVYTMLENYAGDESLQFNLLTTSAPEISDSIYAVSFDEVFERVNDSSDSLGESVTQRNTANAITAGYKFYVVSGSGTVYRRSVYQSGTNAGEVAATAASYTATPGSPWSPTEYQARTSSRYQLFSSGKVQFYAAKSDGNVANYIYEFGKNSSFTGITGGDIYYTDKATGKIIHGQNISTTANNFNVSTYHSNNGVLIIYLRTSENESPHMKTIKFDANGGTIPATSSDTITARRGQEIKLPKPDRPGHIFKGWYTTKTSNVRLGDDDGSAVMPSIKDVSGLDLVAADTLYARWEETDKFTITLNANASDATPGTSSLCQWKGVDWYTDTKTTTKVDKISTPTRPGYRFRGYALTNNATTASYWTTDTTSRIEVENPGNTTFSGNTELFAVWDLITCKLQFDWNAGGDAIDGVLPPSSGDNQLTATYGSPMEFYWIGYAAEPQRVGYTFLGWYDAKTGGDKYYEYYEGARGYIGYESTKTWMKTYTTTQTLYAHWSANTISITWYANGGSWGSTTSRTAGQTYGNNLSLEEDPSRIGYIFSGWYDASSGGSKITTSTKVPSSEATYYAHWTKTGVYTVSLNKNANDAVDGAKTAVYYWPDKGYQKTNASDNSTVISSPNNLIAKADLPTRPGYDCAGFYSATTNGTQYVDSSGNLTSNAPKLTDKATWYAQWTKKSDYVVTLDKNATDAVNGTVTAVYYWPDKGYQKTNASTNLTIVEKDKNLIASNALPTRNGYDFAGFYSAKSGGYQYVTSSGNLTSDAPKLTDKTTWYAQWTNAKYSITWNMKGHGVNQEPKTTEYTFGGSFALPKLADDGGWGFGGWFTDDGCTTKAKDIDSSTYGDKTFYAKWTENTYQIEYNMKGHGIAPTSPTSWKYGTATALSDPDAVEGWTFGGWYTDYNCTTPAKIDASTVGDQLFYAKWTLNEHKVYWRYDGGNGGSDSEETKSYGDEFHLRNPGSKAGYKFAGWKTSGPVDDGNTYGEEYLTTKKYKMPDGAVTFTAQWNPHTYIQVSLSDPYLSEKTAQGEVWYWPEKGYVDSKTSKTVIEYGKHIKDVPNLKSEGYEFLGWYDDVNENKYATKMIDELGNVNTAYAPAAAAEGEAIVWYAHWNRVSCPVDLIASYEPASGEDAFAIANADSYMKRIQYAYFDAAFSESAEGGTIPESQLPKRIGYTFMGYYTQKNPEISVADSTDASKYNGTQWIASDGKLSKEAFDQRPGKRENFTLYAAWRLDECEVTFDPTGNVNGIETDKEQVTLVNAPNSVKWSYGKEKTGIPVASDATFYRTGYEFGGWYYLDGSDKVFVSDSHGNPTPANWDVVKTSVTLYPYWTAKTYTIVLDDDFPKIEGMEDKEKTEKSTEAVYDEPLDLSKFTPEFAPYTFKGWYTDTEQFFEETHMTESSDGTKRFTPRGSYAAMSEIDLHAHWSEPGKYQYTLMWKFPGTDEIVESVHDYYFTDTVKFDGTEAPTPVPAGYRFEGWVEMPYYKDAHDALSGSEPYMEGDTTDGWKPMSMRDRFFVAKWNTRAFSVSFSTTPHETTESGESWLRNTDLLENWEDENGNKGSALPWEDACDLADQSGSDMSTGITYDVTMPSFVLPDVKRKGQVFEGWKLLDAEGKPTGEPERGIVVEPSKQDAQGMRDLVYVPVFKDAYYTIILDANVYGEEMRFEGDHAIPYSGEFTFPYPATLSTGSVFVCWGEDSNTVSDGPEKFYPMQTVKIAPTYNEMGEMTAFGLAHLANDENEIRLYAVWNNATYNVDVPLFANLAIDTDRGDVIAGTNTIAPDPENADTDAIYRIESIRYEPLKNDEGIYAFQREGDPTDKVYLSVYAGLNTGDATDLEHLLYAENIDKDGGTDGEVTYTDANGDIAKASPLLIELGGTTPVVYGRTALGDQPSLESVTDKTGFVTFGQSNPLTIRYGLYFESEQTRKDFAFNDKYQWLLPKNDGANKKTESVNTEDEDYGRGNAWSGSTVDVAKLHYTVSLVDAAK